MGDSVGSNSVTDAFNNPQKWEDVYGGGGNGWKIMAEGTYYINESFGIIAVSGYSWGGGYSIGSQNGTDPIVYATKYVIKASYLPVNIGLKLRTRIGNIMPYIYMAPGMYFPQQKETISRSGIFAAPDEIINYSFAMGFGFTGGVGAAIMVLDNMGVKLEIVPTYAFANVTKSTDQQGNVTTTTIYKNNTTNTTDTHGQPRFTFNSVAMKAGVYYRF
jgi:hypothetical protein